MREGPGGPRASAPGAVTASPRRPPHQPVAGRDRHPSSSTPQPRPPRGRRPALADREARRTHPAEPPLGLQGHQVPLTPWKWVGPSRVPPHASLGPEVRRGGFARPGPRQPAALGPPPSLPPSTFLSVVLLLGCLVTLRMQLAAANKEQVTQATRCLVAVLSPSGRGEQWGRRRDSRRAARGRARVPLLLLRL